MWGLWGRWGGKGVGGQGFGRSGTPGIDGASCSQKLDAREDEAGRCLPTLILTIAPPPPQCLTLISFLESVSFAFPKSRWRSQYVCDEYFIS